MCGGGDLLTSAALAVTAAVVDAEKIHEVRGREARRGVLRGGRQPQRGVPSHRGQAVRLDAVQVQPCVACVPGILK